MDTTVSPSLRAKARFLLEDRVRRRDIFGEHGALLHDPAWDILLALAAKPRPIPEKTLAADALQPASLVRWLRALEHDGLISVDTDGVVLTEDGEIRMHAYLQTA